tara:strand:+ start:423 stop:758 length:336 start_codon:yes stop_codon:yes gene_type:complete
MNWSTILFCVLGTNNPQTCPPVLQDKRLDIEWLNKKVQKRNTNATIGWHLAQMKGATESIEVIKKQAMQGSISHSDAELAIQTFIELHQQHKEMVIHYVGTIQDPINPFAE